MGRVLDGRPKMAAVALTVIKCTPLGSVVGGRRR